MAGADLSNCSKICFHLDSGFLLRVDFAANATSIYLRYHLFRIQPASWAACEACDAPDQRRTT